MGVNDINSQSFYFPLSGATTTGVETGLSIATVITDAIDGITGAIDEMYIANRFGHWFRLPWAWALLCHSVYGRDVAKQLVQLVNSGRLARSGVLAAKIDYAGVLADDALWAAVVAFAAGTDPLDAAAHTQSLKKLRRERFPAHRAPRSAVAGLHNTHTTHNTRHANAPSTRHRRSAHHLDDASAFGTRVDGVGVGPLQPTPRTP